MDPKYNPTSSGQGGDQNQGGMGGGTGVDMPAADTTQTPPTPQAPTEGAPMTPPAETPAPESTPTAPEEGGADEEPRV